MNEELHGECRLRGNRPTWPLRNVNIPFTAAASSLGMWPLPVPIEATTTSKPAGPVQTTIAQVLYGDLTVL